MRYFRTPAFKRAYDSLDPSRRTRVNRALLQLDVLYARAQRPFGLAKIGTGSDGFETRVTKEADMPTTQTDPRITVERPTQERLQALGVKAWPIWTKERSTFDWVYEEAETCDVLEGEV